MIENKENWYNPDQIKALLLHEEKNFQKKMYFNGMDKRQIGIWYKLNSYGYGSYWTIKTQEKGSGYLLLLFRGEAQFSF